MTRGNKNESFGVSSSDGFSSYSSDSSEDNSRTGRGKPAAWSQSSEGAKGRVKT